MSAISIHRSLADMFYGAFRYEITPDPTNKSYTAVMFSMLDPIKISHGNCHRIPRFNEEGKQVNILSMAIYRWLAWFRRHMPRGAPDDWTDECWVTNGSCISSPERFYKSPSRYDVISQCKGLCTEPIVLMPWKWMLGHEVFKQYWMRETLAH